MKKVFSLILVILMLATSVSAGAVGVHWSKTKLATGDVTVNVTGVVHGDRVAVAVYSGGVFSQLEMAWAEDTTVSVPVTIKSGEDTVRAFVWEQDTMKPRITGCYLTYDGIMDPDALFSDNQMVNNPNAVGYKTINALTDDYSITFDLVVKEKGDNAIMLGDSNNGTIGYAESSAILQFNGDNFTTRRGNGTGSYSEDAKTICAVELNKIYTVTIQGNASTNTFMIKIGDGTTEYVSDIMAARTNATAAGIDTIAFVNNSKNTTVTNGYYSNYNFYGTNFKISTENIEHTPLYTYDGFEGLYYGLEVVETGKYARGNNGQLTADYSSAADASAMFIPRDMGDGSHAFVCKSSNNRITTTGAIANLTSAGYAAANNTQHWVLEESENYSDTNRTYYFKHIDSGNYIGLSGTNLALVNANNKKEIRLVPVEGQSPLYLVSQMNVYNLLSDAQRERLESIYESVAGDVFGRYGGTAEWTPRIRMDNMFNEILAGNLTEAEQLAKITEFLTGSANGYIYSGQASYQMVSTSLPGTEGVYYEIDEGTAGNYDFWRGTMLNGMLYKYKIYDANGTLQQTIDLYVEDQATAQTNGETFKQIITQLPYTYRRNLHTVKIRNDGANSYNGGGGVLYIRLNWSPNVNDMRSTVCHELGHINDQAYGTWSSGSGWTSAIAADMYAPSTYGASNSTEDFAEFCRMYMSAYGNPDMQKGLQVLMPNRYASFGRMRQNNMGGWGLWEDEYTTYGYE